MSLTKEMSDQSEQGPWGGAGLQEIPLDRIQEAIPDLLARNSAHCDTQYGTRTDDGALVFHFFPPGHALNSDMDWADWRAFRNALEHAAMRCFDHNAIDADYVPELKSFYLRIKPRPAVPDLTALIERFFSILEA